jgi:hypothetical protein
MSAPAATSARPIRRLAKAEETRRVFDKHHATATHWGALLLALVRAGLADLSVLN